MLLKMLAAAFAAVLTLGTAACSAEVGDGEGEGVGVEVEGEGGEEGD